MNAGTPNNEAYELLRRWDAPGACRKDDLLDLARRIEECAARAQAMEAEYWDLLGAIVERLATATNPDGDARALSRAERTLLEHIVQPGAALQTLLGHPAAASNHYVC